MTFIRLIIALSLVVVLVPAIVEGKTHRSPRHRSTPTAASEPGYSFALIDKQLTLLGQQQSALLQGDSAARGDATRSMRRTLARIERVALRVERLYQHRGEPYGRRMFRVLRIRASEVGSVVERSANQKSSMASASQQLNDRILALITQFQAASGGFTALRCEPGQFSCCKPKRKQDLRPGESLACRWICVKNASSCNGFRGPQISTDNAKRQPATRLRSGKIVFRRCNAECVTQNQKPQPAPQELLLPVFLDVHCQGA